MQTYLVSRYDGMKVDSQCWTVRSHDEQRWRGWAEDLGAAARDGTGYGLMDERWSIASDEDGR